LPSAPPFCSEPQRSIRAPVTARSLISVRQGDPSSPPGTDGRLVSTVVPPRPRGSGTFPRASTVGPAVHRKLDDFIRGLFPRPLVA
jgi:hypothetical protein